MNKKIKQSIDLLIDKADEMVKIQKDVGAKLIDKEMGDVLVYETKKLLEYADVLECKVKRSTYTPPSGKVCIEFEYRGYCFASFPCEEEYEKIKEKVLPPYKVTEPNQNA